MKQPMYSLKVNTRFTFLDKTYIRIPEMVLDTPDGGSAVFNCIWSQKEAAPYQPPEYRIEYLCPETEVNVIK